MTDNTPNPIRVSTSPTAAQVAAGVRQLGLVAGAVVTMATFASHDDIAGLVAYVQSNAFVTAAGIVGGAVAFLYGQWKTRHDATHFRDLAANPDVPQVLPKSS